MGDERPIWTEDVDNYSFTVFALKKDDTISIVDQQTGNELLEIKCTCQDEKPSAVVIRKMAAGTVGVVSFCFLIQPGSTPPLWVELCDLQETDWDDNTKKEVARLTSILDKGGWK